MCGMFTANPWGLSPVFSDNASNDEFRRLHGYVGDVTISTNLKRHPAVTRRSAGLILLGSACSAAAVLRVRPLARDDPKPQGEGFDETYMGRRIVGTRLPGPEPAGADTWHVTVDGRPLHLMRRADGTYLSMVDHYASCPTPLDAAKGAVAELGDQQLRAHGKEM